MDVAPTGSQPRTGELDVAPDPAAEPARRSEELLRAVSEQLSQLAGRLDRLDGRLEQMGGGVEALAHRVDGIGDRLEEVSAEVAGLGALSGPGPAGVPSTLVGVPGQLDVLGSTLSEVRLRLGDVEAVGGRLDRVEELITAIAQQVADDARTVSAARQEPAAALNGLAHQVAELETALRAALDDQRRAHQANLTSFSETLQATLATRTMGINDSVERASGQTRDAFAAIGAGLPHAVVEQLNAQLRNELGALAGRLDLLREQLDGVERAVGGVATTTASLPDAIGANRAELNEVVAGLQETVAELVRAGTDQMLSGVEVQGDLTTRHVDQRLAALTGSATDRLLAALSAAETGLQTSFDTVATATSRRIDAHDNSLRQALAEAGAATEARLEIAEATIGAHVEAATAATAGRLEAGETTLRRAFDAGRAATVMRLESLEAALRGAVEISQAAQLARLEALDARTGALVEAAVADVIAAAAGSVTNVVGTVTAANDSLAAVVRTELVGLRLGQAMARQAEDTSRAEDLGARLDRITAGLDSDLAARLQPLVESTAGLAGTSEGTAEAVRAGVAAVLASQAETAAAVTGTVGRVSADLSGSLVEAVAGLLAEQLGELDRRQGVIEDGLRALWGRLDAVSSGVDGLRLGADLPDEVLDRLEQDLAVAVRDAAAEAAENAVAAVADRVAGHASFLHEELGARIAESAPETAELVRAHVADIAGMLADQMAGQMATLPDEVTVRMADSTAGLVPEWGVVLGEALADLPDAVANRMNDTLVGLPVEIVDQVSASVREQLPALLAGPVEEAVGRAATHLRESVDRLPEEFGTRLDRSFVELPGRLSSGISNDLGATLAAEVATRVAGQLTEEVREAVVPAVAEGGEAFGARAADAIVALSNEVVRSGRAAIDAGREAIEQAGTSLSVTSREVADELRGLAAGAVADDAAGRSAHAERSARVEHDLHDVGSRLDNLAAGLDGLRLAVAELSGRRRAVGGAHETVALLRQVVADAERTVPRR